jgi:2-methylisocitrate lyase-like PEP mutase family enzyme
VNVLLSTTELSIPELAELGVRRVSVGGALARAVWTRFDEVARTLLEQGRLHPR